MVQHDIIVIMPDDAGPHQFPAFDRNRDTTNRVSLVDFHFASLFRKAHPYPAMPNFDLLTRANQVTGTGAQTRHGMSLLQAYAQAVCTPTRAEILTGQRNLETRIGSVLNVPNSSPRARELCLPPSPVLRALPWYLRDVGYKCGAFGKSHLYLDRTNQPLITDEFSSAYDGYGPRHMVDVMGFNVWKGSPRNLPTGYSSFPYYDSTTDTLTTQTGKHTTQRIFEDATAWILAQQAAGQRYFAYLSLNIVHTPFTIAGAPADPGGLMPDPGSPAQHAFGTVAALNALENSRSGGQTWIYTRARAALEHFDYWLGQMLAQIGGNPIIAVWGDNGAVKQMVGTVGFPATPVVGEPYYPFTIGPHTEDLRQLETKPYVAERGKNTLYQGGIHIPALVSGPASMIHANNRGGALEHIMTPIDLTASILDWADFEAEAGVGKPGTGISFAPTLLQAAPTPARTKAVFNYWRSSGVPELDWNEVWFEAYIEQVGADTWKFLRQRTTSMPDGFLSFYNLAEGARAFGTVTVNSVPALGTTLTIGDGAGPAIVFEFTDGAGAAPGNVEVNRGVSGNDTFTALGLALQNMRPPGEFAIVTVGVGANLLELTHDQKLASGNVMITHTTGGALTVTGMAGGVDNGRLESNDLGTAHPQYQAQLDAMRAFLEPRSGLAGRPQARITIESGSEVEVS